MAVNLMNKAEKRIIKRMLDEENLEASNAPTNVIRLERICRRNAIREIAERFERHANRIKNERRERKARKSGSTTVVKRNRKPPAPKHERLKPTTMTTPYVDHRGR